MTEVSEVGPSVSRTNGQTLVPDSRPFQCTVGLRGWTVGLCDQLLSLWDQTVSLRSQTIGLKGRMVSIWGQTVDIRNQTVGL